MEPGGRRLPSLFPTGDSHFSGPQTAVFGQASEAGPPAAFEHPVIGETGSALPAAAGPRHLFNFRPLNPFPASTSFGTSAGVNFGQPEPIFSSLGHADLQRSGDADRAPGKFTTYHFSQPPSTGGEGGVFGSQKYKAGPSAPIFSFSQATSSSSSSLFGLPRPKATTSLPDTFSFFEPTTTDSSADSFRFVQPALDSNRSSDPFPFSQPSAASSVNALASNKTLGSEEITGQKPAFLESPYVIPLPYGWKYVLTGAGGTPGRTEHEVEEQQLTPKKGVKRNFLSPQEFERSPAKDQAVGTRSRHPLEKRLVKVAPSTRGDFRRTIRDVLKEDGRRQRETKGDRARLEDETFERIKRSTETSIPLKWPSPVRKEETKNKFRDDLSSKTPSRRLRRDDRTESLPGTSLSELTAIQCKNIPADLNKKGIIRKHFSQFGKVRSVYCQSRKNEAVIRFTNNLAASTAKKNGKLFCERHIEIYWQRKKKRRRKKSSREEGGKPKGDEKPSSDKPDEERKPEVEHSPLRNPTVKASSVGNITNREREDRRGYESRSEETRRTRTSRSLGYRHTARSGGLTRTAQTDGRKRP